LGILFSIWEQQNKSRNNVAGKNRKLNEVLDDAKRITNSGKAYYSNRKLLSSIILSKKTEGQAIQSNIFNTLGRQRIVVSHFQPEHY
jgi:hypothetical protein